MSEPIPRKADIDDSCTRIWLNDLHDRGLRPSVKLGGIEQKRVMSYDIDRKEVVIQMTHNGQPYCQPGTDSLAVATLRGPVTVEIVPIEN